MNNLEHLSNDELLLLYKNKKNKEATYDAMQMALKLALNSLYGAQANKHFRYYSTDIAEGITLTGQFTIRYIANALDSFLNEKLKLQESFIVASDTDSVYLCLDKLVEKVVPADTPTNKIVDFIDKFIKTVIEPFIETKYAILADYVNAMDNKMQMKREAIANRAIWRAKKNYILQVYDNEGVRYNEPKLKTVGIETARTSTPNLVRKSLTECLSILLNQKEEAIHQYVADFKNKFMSAPISDIAFPRGVSDIDKWIDGSGKSLWISGAPIHVKAAIVYNSLIDKYKLKNYAKIHNGDKIKFIYLKIPNPTHNNAIAFIDFLHPEFQMDEYIDKEMQFKSVFLEPLRSFTSILGWNTEKRATITDFFDNDTECKNTQEKALTFSPARATIKKQSKTPTSTLEGFF